MKLTEEEQMRVEQAFDLIKTGYLTAKRGKIPQGVKEIEHGLNMLKPAQGMRKPVWWVE